ncbi:MAG: hypothetical protein DRJ47_06030 [Thermoprotei archaeon]|nr:MAG: hypothetical protein DRJ47_06030 [Thermoprotei archaeon]
MEYIYCPYCGKRLVGEENDDELDESFDSVNSESQGVLVPVATITQEELERANRVMLEILAKQYLLDNWQKFVRIEECKSEEGKVINIKEINNELEELVVREVRV